MQQIKSSAISLPSALICNVKNNCAFIPQWYSFCQSAFLQFSFARCPPVHRASKQGRGCAAAERCAEKNRVRGIHQIVSTQPIAEGVRCVFIQFQCLKSCLSLFLYVNVSVFVLLFSLSFFESTRGPVLLK